ncbi:hypothetical protein B566_EDAN011199 [Ephemera danica]|nr:hypothetical protein B566_EDAN011199 [Ephemera danica]
MTIRCILSPGDILLSKPTSGLLPALTPPRSIAPNTLTVPSESQQCSIVTEEEDDEGDGESSREGGGGGPGRCSLNRRGSRSEGKLSLALQQRLAEARSNNKPPPPPIPSVPTTQITASATVTLPPTQPPLPVQPPARFKTLPAPSRPLHSVNSSPQLTLNEIFEEGAEKTTPSAIPRVVVTRQKFHKNRTASCSSSDASDEDSESRKKREVVAVRVTEGDIQGSEDGVVQQEKRDYVRANR